MRYVAAKFTCPGERQHVLHHAVARRNFNKHPPTYTTWIFCEWFHDLHNHDMRLSVSLVHNCGRWVFWVAVSENTRDSGRFVWVLANFLKLINQETLETTINRFNSHNFLQAQVKPAYSIQLLLKNTLSYRWCKCIIFTWRESTLWDPLGKCDVA